MNVAARMCSNAKEGSICASRDFMRHLEGATTFSASASEPQSSVSEHQSSVNAKEGSICASRDLCGSEEHLCTEESNGLVGGGHALGEEGRLLPPALPSAQPERPVFTDQRNVTITATSGGVSRSGGGGGGGGVLGSVFTDERNVTITVTARGVHNIKGKGPMELFDITPLFDIAVPATTRAKRWNKSGSTRILQEASIENLRTMQNAVVGEECGASLPLLETSDAWQRGRYAMKRFSHTFESPEVESEFLESHVYVTRLRCVCVCV